MESPGTITIVGAGVMGRGIARVAAGAGYRVILNDLPEVLNGIPEYFDSTADLKQAAMAADLVIEAVPEDLKLKMTIFRKLDSVADPSVVLATNTSSLPVSEIAAVTGRQEKVVGMHFFNPVSKMRLVEVVRADQTSDETVEQAVRTGRTMGKEPIVVRDSPGFASSRLGLALGLEAMRMLEHGVASAEDIDKAMTLGYRHPVGPLKLTDIVGLDVRLAVAEHLFRTLGADGFSPPEILKNKVAEGKLGRKTGEGFYRWEKK